MALKLEALIQEREAIGQKMEQLSVEDTSVVELIERATSLSSQLEECIESMVEIQYGSHFILGFIFIRVEFNYENSYPY